MQEEGWVMCALLVVCIVVAEVKNLKGIERL